MLAGLAMLACLPLAADEAVEKELRKLEGTWMLIGVEADGERTPGDTVKEYRVTIEGTSYLTTTPKEKRRGTLAIDPTRKPRTMDITIIEGLEKGHTQHAIYELDGDTLRICGASPGKDRPTDFETKGRTGWTLLLLKRVK
jgi:uncharacterized protein (TIGR03067 family)